MSNIYINVLDYDKYDKLFNFICGARGVGKTFSLKKFMLDNWLSNKKRCVYIRRYATEFKRMKAFFDKVILTYPELYKDIKIDIKKDHYLINNEIAGYFITLSKYSTDKSTDDYADITHMFFDEFLIINKVYHYLPDEIFSFFEMYETIARLNDVKVYFISNAFTAFNPYFNYWNIGQSGKKFETKKDLLFTIAENENYTKAKKATRFGQLIEDSEFFKYAYEASFLLDNDKFIEKKSGKLFYSCTITIDSKQYGVWSQVNTPFVFMSHDIDPSCKYSYVFTKNDHNSNTLLIKYRDRGTPIDHLLKSYNRGCLRFETGKCKAAFEQLYKYY